MISIKKILLILFLALFNSIAAQTQELPSDFKLRNRLLLSPTEVALADSLPPAVKRNLLPEKMSFVERGIWGENGVFRSIGLASPLTSEVRKSELNLRRTMLTVHQVGGFVTLGLMGTAAYFGQKVLDGNYSARYNHFTFVYATLGSYTVTGLLSVLSPPPLIRRDEFSTTTIHKTLAWLHFAGMVVTPILARGRLTPEREHIHQVSAYVTTAIFAAALIVITL